MVIFRKILRSFIILTLCLIVVAFSFSSNISDMWNEEETFTNKIFSKYSILNLTKLKVELARSGKEGPVNLSSERIEPHSLEEIDHLKLVAYGDAGKGNHAQYLVAQSMEKVCGIEKCNVFVSLGDNIYPSGIQSISDPLFTEKFEKPYRSFIEKPTADFWMTVGNHDRRGSINAQIDYSLISPIWKMPAPDYPIPKLPRWLNIYVLDTSFIAPGVDLPPFQTKIRENFEGQLARAKNHLCNKNGWKVIVTHHPLHSSGSVKNKFREKNLRDALLPFIESCKIDLVLSGHEHLQQHLRTNGFEMIVQGAAAEVRDNYKIVEEGVYSKYLGDEMGFSLLEFSIDSLNIKFFNEKGDTIYKDVITRIL